MPANYTRRRDLFLDAGFADPDAQTTQILDEARLLGLLPDHGEPALDGQGFEAAMARAAERAHTELAPILQRLLEHSPQWIFERGGDLATFLWQARALQGAGGVPVGPLVFGLAARLWQAGFAREAAALVRFVAAMDFDYGALYTDNSIAYGFFQPREPNPFVWKLLKFVEKRAQGGQTHLATGDLRVLELGCGIGNDALGMLSHPRCASYTGVDISPLALAEHQKRVAPLIGRRPELAHRTLQGDFVSVLEEGYASQKGFNLIYSYSSLHYFSSEELSRIFQLVHHNLAPSTGLFCFAIKGKDSIWDGQGMPLYRPDVWINRDGQSRWFPSRRSIGQLCDSHQFEILLHEDYEHWGYSEHGERDVFHYVICTPRP